MRGKKYLLLLLCIPLLFTGCKKIPKLDNGQEVIVELNGKQFTANNLFDELKKSYGASVLINMVDKYITEQELTEDLKKEATKNAQTEYNSYYAYYSTNWDAFLANYGFKNNEEFLKQLTAKHEQDLVLKKYMKSDVIKDDELQTYYDKNIYGEITARHILLIPYTTDEMTDAEKKAAKEKSYNEAKELIKQLNESSNLEEDFAKLAKEKSNDTGTASQGGLIENFTNDSGLVTEFWDASLKLETGKMSQEPVESKYGYHIIFKMSQNEKPSLDTVKDKVKDKVVEELLSATNSNYVYWSGLREKYGMTINDSVLKDSYDSTIKNLKK